MSALQFRQNDDVELQPFRLVDRHHANIGGNGIGDSRGFDVSDEVAGTQRRRGVIGVCFLDQLLQAAQLATAAQRGECPGPSLGWSRRIRPA